MGTNLTKHTQFFVLSLENGIVKKLITKAICCPQISNTERCYIACTFTNEGTNFSAAKIVSGYQGISILSRKIGLGIYEFDVKIDEQLSGMTMSHMLPQASIINATSGGWNKRCIAVENWGIYSGYWRIRVITTDAGNNKRVETHVNVVMMARTKKN